jgi:FMN phosphatase YigB (HAD superfamily)
MGITRLTSFSSNGQMDASSRNPMVDVSEKLSTKTPGVLDWLHGAVDNAYTRKAIDFAEAHKEGLAAAGILIAGTAAIVGGSRFGAFEKTAALLKSAVTGEGLLTRGAVALGDAASVGERATAAQAALLKNVDTYIFDMDRTLVDTDGAFRAYSDTLHAGITARSGGLSADVVRKALDNTEARMQTKFFGRRLDLVTDLKAHYPAGLDLNWKFNCASKEAEAAYHAALQPKPETIEMLDALKAADKKLILFTGGSPVHTAEKLDASGLGKYFDKVYTNAKHPFEDLIGSNLTASGESKAKIIELQAKPKAGSAGYQAILKDAGILPKRAAMTGDHIDEDIARSKKNGMTGIWATWYAKTGTSKVIPDLVLTSPEDLTRIITHSAK